MYSKLKAMRTEKNITVKKMAKKLNISSAFYCQIENGNRNLSYNMACRISKIFRRQPDFIFYEEEMSKEDK